MRRISQWTKPGTRFVQVELANVWLAATLLVLLMFLNGTLNAQNPLMPSQDVLVDVDSGSHFNHGDEPQLVWTQEVRARNAKWVRLNFSHLVLGHDPLTETSSTLRIISLKDEAVQVLDGVSARQWQNTSAYFNGDGVILQLFAYPNGRLNKVTVNKIVAGETPDATESICDTNDDRILSNDPRAGRTAPGGCTGWLFNDRKNCMLTAGHCASSTDVMLFNVPISNSDGSYNFPGPEDQYAVDPGSVQFVNNGVGDDWCYFGCFENSNTGLTAFEAQGMSYQLELPSPNVNDPIRITGYGTTSSPISNTYNGAQKTQVGPTATFSNSALGYRTDTTGGNSGSPVIFDNTGVTIGIHTHGGCGSGGSGNNWGTGANNAGFQAALANPLGICRGAIDFDFPNGRPETLDPNGGTTFRVVATDGGETPIPGTGKLHVNDGSGFVVVPMTEVSPNVYDAVFPPTRCGAAVDYFVSAENATGDQFHGPENAPTISFEVISGSSIANTFDDDFESNLGWTVAGDATDGQWERGVPAGGGTRGDPATDGDGSGNCYVTDNVAGNSDVDGGSTILTSPLMDADVGAGQKAVLSYYRWYNNVAGSAPEEDFMLVEISNDGGANWFTLEVVGPSGPAVRGGWIHKVFEVDQYLAPTNQMRIRFTASDLNNGSVVEAGVDGVQINVVDCQQTAVPDSFNLVKGELNSGDIGDLHDSDNQRMIVRRGVNQIGTEIIVDFSATSHAVVPLVLNVQLEASVLARSTIVQKIEMFNHQTGTFEQVDSRNANRTGDQVVSLNLSGDLSRFVDPATREISARIRFNTLAPRQQFVGRLDQLIWTITH